MRTRVCTTSVCMAFLIVLPCATFAEAQSKPSKKLAMFRLRGFLYEAPRGISLMFMEQEQGTLRGFVERLDKAAKDKEIVGVVLLVEDPTLGTAQVQEIRSAIARLRKAGKPVHCHLASAGSGDYMLAAACDRISMVPSGALVVTGVSAEALYLKGLLDKLGIVADMTHCGEYKGAAEPLTRTGPSEPIKEQMNRLLGDLYQQIVDTIAQSRHLKAEEVRKVIDRGLLTARQAAAAGLVDELKYQHEFLAEVRKRFDGAEIVKQYGRKKGPEIDFASPFGIFKLFGEMMKPTAKKGKDTIALVYVDGLITDGRSGESLFGEMITGSATLQSVLLKAAKDSSVKAVVLRIDSPGGSALASDIIYQACQVIRQTHKPVIASMGDTAASGGYYVASGSDKIFAEPATLTGSIGVVGGKIVFGGLFDMIGITTHSYKFGRNADLFSPTHPFDEAQRKVFLDLMTDCAIRGDRLKGDIDDLAGGRVYTGKQALGNGLVDAIGDLDQAIADAARRAKITDYQVRIMPKPKTLFDYINEAFGLDDDNEDASVQGRANLLPWLRSETALAGVLPAVRQLAPEQAGCLVRMLWRIELLRRESVLMVTPGELMIR
jgi:protease-4